MPPKPATTDEMFEAAKYVHASWFPQQTLEVAIFVKATANLDFAQVDARQATGRELFSGGGFRALHGWLATMGCCSKLRTRAAVVARDDFGPEGAPGTGLNQPTVCF